MTHHDHQTLEILAADLAQAVANRRDWVATLRRQVLDLVTPLLPSLREAAAAERDCHDALLAAVTAAPGLFVTPRTRTVHGVKYGWVLGKARIDIPDEVKTISLIRQKLPPEQQVLLIRVKEAVERRAVLDLTAADLRRLAIRQLPGDDQPLVSLPKDATDKLLDALLAETAEDHHG